jgi:hypothetical protein
MVEEEARNEGTKVQRCFIDANRSWVEIKPFCFFTLLALLSFFNDINVLRSLTTSTTTSTGIYGN